MINYSKKYRENGYLIINDVYSEKDVDEIRNLVSKLNLEKFEHSKDKTGYPFRITNILPRNQELKKLIEKPEIFSILKQCIGDDIVFFKKARYQR